MNGERIYSSPLRQEQAEGTRRKIVEAAIELISEQPYAVFSHEEIAQRAGIALRTVYRHFPVRTELLDAVWQESDRRLGLMQYPNTEEALLASVKTAYQRMDENAPLIRGLLHSDAGREMRQRDNERRRTGVVKALAPATGHLPKAERDRVTGIFQVLFGGRTWEMLRDRARLGEGESAKAVDWAMRTLLDALYREQSKTPRVVTSGGNGKSGTNGSRKKCIPIRRRKV